jgi:hypothetical protein
VQRGLVTSLVAYDETAPLLLVTAFGPGNQGGGAVILRSLLRGSESRVVWASLDRDDVGYDGPRAHLGSRCNPWLLPPGLLARRVDAVAERHSAAAVWAVAHGPVVPCLPALRAISSRGLHLSVHDDPAWGVAFRGRRQRPLAPWLHVQFGRALAGATSVDAIGGGMRAAIARRTGRDSIIVHRVLDGSIGVNRSPQDTSRLTVGLLGSVYSSRQLKLLTAMLARASAMVGVPARLAVIGGVSDQMRRAVRDSKVVVEFLGHMSEQHGLEILRRAFALYVGYPFGGRDRAIRRTSFPVKLSTYVQAARPLLVHAPFDSSLTPLFGLQPYVLPWADQDVKHGARVLACAWHRASLRESQHEAAEAVRQAYFGVDNRTRLFDSLNALARAPQVDQP